MRCFTRIPCARTRPVSISYSSAPSDHQSTARPWPVRFKISGARYSGVPQNENAPVSSSRMFSFDSPKSVRRTLPVANAIAAHPSEQESRGCVASLAGGRNGAKGARRGTHRFRQGARSQASSRCAAATRQPHKRSWGQSKSTARSKRPAYR